MRIGSIAVLSGVLMFGAPMLGGCGKEVSHTEQDTQTPNGTNKTEDTKTKMPNGDTVDTKTQEHTTTTPSMP